ncbi:MAG TPA: cytochrome c-type biogenesis protein CcmH [Candidatus Polarisedimenticolia bacterium]|nr:cytochrome c-type biogenesis protein CcmH [Candidatus Polarisedimenticolia bacterium]
MPPEIAATARPSPILPRSLGLALALFLANPGARDALAAPPTAQQQIESRLMCYCGCSDLTVRVCTCGTADAIRGEIATRLSGGETPDQVVAAFVAQYGEQIRSAPTKTGFDLVAWITPFAVLILAGSALAMTVRRWGTARPAPTTAPASPNAAAATPEERRALERVRREMREQG